MDIREQILDVIEMILQDGNIRSAVDINDDLAYLGINSINYVKIVIELEDELDIEFEDDKIDFSQFPTFTDLCTYVEKLVREND